MERFTHYFPTALYFGDTGIEVRWEDLGSERFTEAFFGQAIEKRRSERPKSPPRTTSLGALTALVRSRPGLYPSGFIFHMSRCGSTLTSRMLASLDRSIVIAEPTILSISLSIVRPYLTNALRERMLQDLVSALGQVRRRDETLYFIKFTSADILHIETVLRCFPGTPWVFIHRNPIEVGASLVEKPNGWLHAKRAGRPLPLTGEPPEELCRRPDEEYCALMLSSFLAAAARARDDKCLCVDYRDLPEAVPSSVARHFGFELNSNERTNMLAIASHHSKDNSARQVFVPDSARKLAMASPSLRAAILRHTEESYATFLKNRGAGPQA